jgi:ketosteroid isomerase-like protein
MKTRKLPLMTLVFAALISMACSSQQPSSAREFAERFIAAENKAWGTGDLADLKALEATDIVFHLAGTELSGWDSHQAYILNGRSMVSDLKQTWKYLSGEGNHIALAYESSAVVKATDSNPAQAVSNTYLFVLRLKDGKIAEIWANGSSTNKPVEGGSE